MAQWNCLRFLPTDQEIFELFLIPKIAIGEGINLPGSLIDECANFYGISPTIAARNPSQHFFPNHYWYFVNRLRSSPTSMKADRRITDGGGQWRKTGRSKNVVRGTLNLGSKTTYDHITADRVRSGWRVVEYERALELPTFDPWVVVYLYHETRLDRRIQLENALAPGLAADVPPVALAADVPPVALAADVPPVALAADVPPIALAADVPPVALAADVPPVALAADVPPIALAADVPPDGLNVVDDNVGVVDDGVIVDDNAGGVIVDDNVGGVIVDDNNVGVIVDDNVGDNVGVGLNGDDDWEAWINWEAVWENEEEEDGA